MPMRRHGTRSTRRRRRTTGTVERTSLYQLLGRAKDEALARRALDLALTERAGQDDQRRHHHRSRRTASAARRSISCSHISSQVNQLIDISGRSRFMQRLAGASRDPALIPVLENYARQTWRRATASRSSRPSTGSGRNRRTADRASAPRPQLGWRTLTRRVDRAGVFRYRRALAPASAGATVRDSCWGSTS